MSIETKIEWTHWPDGLPGKTWNPVRGCSRVSEGCRNCYAERQAARFSNPDSGGMTDLGYEPNGDQGVFHGFARMTKDGPRWTGRVELVESKLEEPLRTRKPARWFLNSMSDIFHESLPFESIAAVVAVVHACPLHTFLVLTKRVRRAREFEKWLRARGGIAKYVRSKVGRAALRHFFDIVARFETVSGKRHRARSDPWMQVFNAAAVEFESAFAFPSNLLLGVSVEDQATADERIPELLATPAALRFVSYEPALGPVDFERVPLPDAYLRMNGVTGCLQTLAEKESEPDDYTYFTRKDMKLDWIIVGGESGPGARPFDIAWARSTIEQCKAAGVACFVKQLGSYPILDPRFDRSISGATRRLRAGKGNNPSEWPEDLRVREFPA